MGRLRHDPVVRATDGINPAAAGKAAVAGCRRGALMAKSDRISDSTDRADPGGGPERGANEAEAFVNYYIDQSLSSRSQRRFQEICNRVLQHVPDRADEVLDVIDVGCGPGELSLRFAACGHRVTGVDISRSLIETAQERASRSGLVVDYRLASAEALPVPDASCDVCLCPELLEHVPDWRATLAELVRVLRPGGVLFLTTTNVLCPVQDEFRLPAYAWYPDVVKRRCIELARTRKPHWVNHADYPAFHWFSFFQLQRELEPMGFRCLDRFDTLDARPRSLKALARWSVQNLPGMRLLGQVLTPYTQLIAVRET